MKAKLLGLTNVLLFVLLTLLLSGAQTALWLQIFGYFAPPALWIPVLAYLALFRGTLPTIILSHLVAISISSATAMPLGMVMISCLAVSLSVQVFKTRIFWMQSTYFMMVSGLSVLIFHITHFAASWVLGDAPLTSPAIGDWTIQALLTPLVAPLLFPLFRWIDALTQHDDPPEVTGTITV